MKTESLACHIRKMGNIETWRAGCFPSQRSESVQSRGAWLTENYIAHPDDFQLIVSFLERHHSDQFQSILSSPDSDLHFPLFVEYYDYCYAFYTFSFVFSLQD
ncbi:hypothetical protein V8G54_033387 [Vigna mungo]|uniref:Uncharacterized protein n=1 Tax=Vigna mungo TaxID=3915 RepID=A0AAQ3MMV0_VIGMU